MQFLSKAHWLYGLFTLRVLASTCFAQQIGAPSPTKEQSGDMAPTKDTALVAKDGKLTPVGGTGWAKTSINSAVFRTSSLLTHDKTQYIAFYDNDSNVILGKRSQSDDTWELSKTQYKGNVKDAHNVISIGVDGDGILHMVWNLHNQNIHYAKSLKEGSLELGDQINMTGDREAQVTYPQFYSLPSGDLLFAYREGSSGDGDVMINRYDLEKQTWQIVQHPLIDGEGKRNAYLNQFVIDRDRGDWHLSWCWRESPDVASNHDVCYAYSSDQGKTWKKTTDEKYTLPITQATAEVAWPVPQNSELINQASMTVDGDHHPVIATYWRPQGTDVPQFQVVWYDGKKWQQSQVTERTQAFRLSGGGTKRIPISRPVVVASEKNGIYVVFRDEERGNGITFAASTDEDHEKWELTDVLTGDLDAWEPTYDHNLWKRDEKLHLFVQRVGQGDGETEENLPPQDVFVLEWTP